LESPVASLELRRFPCSTIPTLNFSAALHFCVPNWRFLKGMVGRSETRKSDAEAQRRREKQGGAQHREFLVPLCVCVFASNLLAVPGELLRKHSPQVFQAGPPPVLAQLESLGMADLPGGVSISLFERAGDGRAGLVGTPFAEPGLALRRVLGHFREAAIHPRQPFVKL